MPGSVILVHDDVALAEDTIAALRQYGFDVAWFSYSLSVLDALEAAHTIDILITRIQFPQGQPNGVALGLMAHNKRPGVKVRFLSKPETEGFTDGVGEMLVAPIAADDVVAKVREMLAFHEAE